MNNKSIIKRIIRKSRKILSRYQRNEDPAKERKKKACILGRKLRLKKNNYIYRNNALKPLFYLPFYRNDYIQQTILTEGTYYEIESLDFVFKEWENGRARKNVKGGCVLDIGANIGNHMLYFFFECEIKHAYCFEPIESTYNILKRNVEINNLENKVTLINSAVGASESLASVSFYDKTNIGATKISLENDGPIPVVSIDSLHVQDSIKLIKIDVEGFEKEVIEGCKETIAENKPYILIEIQPENFDCINMKLNDLGYQYIWLNGINYFFFV